MKRLNPIQVAASASGAVLSALIASVFGVEGTVIGVAVGSIVATTATAIVWESIERTHSKVREVVVKNAHQLPLLRRGETGAAAGVVDAGATSSGIEASVDAGATTEPGPAPRDDAGGDAREDAGDDAAEDVGDTRLVAWSRTGRTSPTPPVGATRRRRPRWPLIVTVAASFALALGLVTVVEVAAGRPLSSIIGASNSSGGTSAGNFLTSTPSPTTTSTTTSTTVPRSTTTTTARGPTTSTSTTTTSTTAPSATTTTTTTTTTPSTTSAGSPAAGEHRAPVSGS